MITWRHHVSSVLKHGNYWNQLLHKVVWQHMHMQDVVGSLLTTVYTADLLESGNGRILIID